MSVSDFASTDGQTVSDAIMKGIGQRMKTSNEKTRHRVVVGLVGIIGIFALLGVAQIVVQKRENPPTKIVTQAPENSPAEIVTQIPENPPTVAAPDLELLDFVPVDETPFDRELEPVEDALRATYSRAEGEPTMSTVSEWLKEFQSIPSEKASSKTKALVLYIRMRKAGAGDTVAFVIGDIKPFTGRAGWLLWRKDETTYILNPDAPIEKDGRITPDQLIGTRQSYMPLYAYRGSQKYRTKDTGPRTPWPNEGSPRSNRPAYWKVASTPYDRQMAHIRSVLSTNRKAGPEVSLDTITLWLEELSSIPYSYHMEWQTPAEVMTRVPSDCKGKALTLYQRLKQNSNGNAFFVIGTRPSPSSKTHCWVDWQAPDGAWYVLDPTYLCRPFRLYEVPVGQYVGEYCFTGSEKLKVK
jgi:hypothetical protein